MLLGKLVRKIPPFKNMYEQMDILVNRCNELEQKVRDLSKQLEKQQKEGRRTWDVEQRFEKNMNQCYEALKQEVRSNKKVMDSRHEWTVERVSCLCDRFERVNTVIATTRNQLQKDIEYNYYKGLHPDQYEDNLKEWYYRRTGEVLNLDNPQTYNEKIQWLKLYDNTQIKSDLADKYKVREYVKEKIGERYLIPLLGVWDKTEDICFDELPEQFVLKANHGCGWNIIVRNKNDFDIKDSKMKLDKWLKTNFAYSAGLEMHYKPIKPVVIAEQYIENVNGDINDYKVFCFGGKAKYIMFLTNRTTNLQMVFYDTEWNKMPFVYSYDCFEGDVEKPENLSELLSVSEKLAEGFPHVRVDFYRLNDGQLKFGEMTFTSYSGVCIWNPPEYNRVLGDMIQLPQLD